MNLCPRCVTGTIGKRLYTSSIDAPVSMMVCEACRRDEEFRYRYYERPWPLYPLPQYVRHTGGRHAKR